MIVGKVLDDYIKPCMVKLNRGLRSETVVGSNRIYYESSSGDQFKVFVPRDYLRMNQHPIAHESQPLIEVYGTSSSNSQVKLANQFTSENDLENDQMYQQWDPMALMMGQDSNF